MMTIIILALQIRDLNLGNNFPVIKAVTPMHVSFHQESSLFKQIDISVEVEYTGGFQLAIDAITKISKTAMVKIKGLFLFIYFFIYLFI